MIYVKNISTTLIGWLAVDEAYKKRGLGELILIDAMKRSYRTGDARQAF